MLYVALDLGFKNFRVTNFDLMRCLGYGFSLLEGVYEIHLTKKLL